MEWSETLIVFHEARVGAFVDSEDRPCSSQHL